MGIQADRIAKSWQPKYKAETRRQFQNDLDGFLDDLDGRKAKIDWRMIGEDWRAIFARAEDRWREAFVPLMWGVITDGASAWNVNMGIQFDIRNLFAEEWFSEYTLKFAQPITTTTKRHISTLLQEARERGSSIPQMQRVLTETFQQFMDYKLSDTNEEHLRGWFEERMPPHRTEMIARTESMRALNAGTFHLFEAWGVTYKEWLATIDGRQRPSHEQAMIDYSEGGTPGPIPMNEPFIVGGASLMQPGDPSGPPSETIFCRCTPLPWMPEWEEL